MSILKRNESSGQQNNDGKDAEEKKHDESTGAYGRLKEIHGLALLPGSVYLGRHLPGSLALVRSTVMDKICRETF
jgi:hypothetical protein